MCGSVLLEIVVHSRESYCGGISIYGQVNSRSKGKLTIHTACQGLPKPKVWFLRLGFQKPRQHSSACPYNNEIAQRGTILPRRNHIQVTWCRRGTLVSKPLGDHNYKEQVCQMRERIAMLKVLKWKFYAQVLHLRVPTRPRFSVLVKI